MGKMQLELSEPVMRTTIFAVILLFLAGLETLLPRRRCREIRSKRWLTNFSLIAIDTIAVRVALPLLTITAADQAAAYGWGGLNQINWPVWLEIIVAIILLDLVVYAQHAASHKIPFLWAFHKVHHADRDMDVTTGFRFHPVEILLSAVFKAVCIFIIGPAAFAVFLFEILLSSSAMFNHANLRLPLQVDAYLRRIIVTPDMHRVHHSAVSSETNSNYGFFLSIWDYLFSTYIPQPREGHENMTVGLHSYQNSHPSQLWWCLLVPFLASSRQQAQQREKRSGKTNRLF